MAADTDEGQLLREHLFEGDLLHLPLPEEGLPGLLPEWFPGEVPALLYPPLRDRGAQDGDSIDLQITPYHLYYGALRELAETADPQRGAALRRLALEWNPQAPLEVCRLAREHLERDVETALLHYELALELDENLYEAAQDAGMCEYTLSAVDAGGSGERLENAAGLFRRAIGLRPQAGLSWWSLARTLNDQGAIEEAEACLRRFLRDYPQGEQRDLVEETLRHGFSPLESEVREDPSGRDDQAVFQQAQALAFGEEPEKAAALLEPLAEEYPESGELWFVLGAAHRRTGESNEAERCLRRAARLMPAEPFVWWELSLACADMAHWQPAEEAIRKCLELDPENAIYLCDLGRILLSRGDRQGAEEAVGQARRLAPDDPDILEAVEALKVLEGK